MRLILMGTGPFAVPSFREILATGFDVPLVVTRPVRGRVGRRGGVPPSPVRQWAEEHQLPLFDPDKINEPESITKLDAEKADLMVVCDYGQILSSQCLETTRLGGINLHGSLLPRYRGASPVQSAMLQGDAETGVSVIHMTPRLDGGPILATRKTEILSTETAGELELRLSEMGVSATIDAINLLSTWDGETSLGETQDPDQVTRAPRLQKAEGLIPWDRPAHLVNCHVRGMQPWPVAFCLVNPDDGRPEQRLMVKEIRLVNVDDWEPELSQTALALPPGSVVADPERSGRFLVTTADGIVELTKVQPAGKREMPGQDFLRGRPLPEGTLIG